jgi:SulP family sulfate permease
VPILDTLAAYTRGQWHADLVAGLVVGVMTVPQAMAYAFLAGLPPEAGLYACLLPMLVYTVFGSSRHLVVGPVAVAALMVAAAIGDAQARHPHSAGEIAAILSLEVGVILLLLRLWQMGGLINLLSHPVISGFINAAAILIIFSQIPAFTGMPSKAGDPFDQLMWFTSHLDDVHVLPLVLSLTCIGGIWFFQNHLAATLRRFDIHIEAGHIYTRLGPLVVLILMAVLVWLFDLASRFGLATVGQVPWGLPSLSAPPFDAALWADLLDSAAMIAIVAYVESYSIATGIAAREQTRINAHQELIALGFSNLAAAFTAAYPVAGSFSRTSVNYDAGARTPLSSIVCGAVIVAALLVLTPLFAFLPAPALAAIVVLSVVRLIDLRSIGRHWRIYREDAITSTLTMVSVLTLGVEAGLLTGVGLSIAFFIRSSSRPEVNVIGRLGDSEHFRSERRHDVKIVPHVVCVRIDENICFANSNQIESKLMKIVHRRPDTRHLLLAFSSVNRLDVTGLEMLFRLNRNLDTRGITLSLAEVKGPVMEQLEATNLKDVLSGSVFLSTDVGMRALEWENSLHERHEPPETTGPADTDDAQHPDPVHPHAP